MTYAGFKRILIGPPFPTQYEIHERLDRVRALAVFASDPISSNAYATEAIMSVLMLRGIKSHYVRVAQSLRIVDPNEVELSQIADVVLVPIADIHRGTLRALKYAKRLSSHMRAVSIIADEDQKARILRRWEHFPELTQGIELVLIDYDYRDILNPLVEYIDQVQAVEYPNQLVTIVIPEFVPRSLAGHLLHNQTANMLRLHLHAHENVVVIDVPYLIADKGMA